MMNKIHLNFVFSAKFHVKIFGGEKFEMWFNVINVYCTKYALFKL